MGRVGIGTATPAFWKKEHCVDQQMLHSIQMVLWVQKLHSYLHELRAKYVTQKYQCSETSEVGDISSHLMKLIFGIA